MNHLVHGKISHLIYQCHCSTRDTRDARLLMINQVINVIGKGKIEKSYSLELLVFPVFLDVLQADLK